MNSVIQTQNFKIILEKQLYEMNELMTRMKKIYNEQEDVNLDVDNLESIHKINNYIEKIDLNLDKIDIIDLESKNYLEKTEKMRLKKYKIDQKIEKTFLPYMLMSRMTLNLNDE